MHEACPVLEQLQQATEPQFQQQVPLYAIGQGQPIRRPPQKPAQIPSENMNESQNAGIVHPGICPKQHNRILHSQQDFGFRPEPNGEAPAQWPLRAYPMLQ
jgi:hypothetical protein